MKEYVIKDLLSYISCNQYMMNFASGSYFKELSYSSWAAKEIIDLCSSGDFINPIDAVASFMKRMDDNLKRTELHNDIYVIARDFAESYLYTLL